MKMTQPEKGHIQEYPCSCYEEEGKHICWIVRYPNDDVDWSYPTKEEAEQALKELREKDPA